MIGGEIATHIARLPKAVQQIALQKVIVNQTDPESPGGKKDVALPLEQAKQILKGAFTIKLESAVFSPDSASLLPCGACTSCEKLSDNAPALLADLGAGTCTDTECFNQKTQAHYQAEIDTARLTGTRVIEGEEAKSIWLSPFSCFVRDWTSVDELALFNVKLEGSEEVDSYTYRDLIEKAGDAAPKLALIVNPHEQKHTTKRLCYVITDEDAEALVEKFQPTSNDGEANDGQDKAPPRRHR